MYSRNVDKLEIRVFQKIRNPNTCMSISEFWKNEKVETILIEFIKPY